MKSISILGSTGSIGTQTLEVIDRLGYKVVGLSSNKNLKLLEKQIEKYKPLEVAVFNKEKADELKEKVDIPVSSGLKGLNRIATLNEADTVVNSVVGSIGLIPTIKSIKSRKNIALANKETLVCAGHIIMGLVKKNKISLMPIDSEHSALFQCLNGENRKKIKQLILTCSGGAFRDKTKKQLEKVKAKDALKHPTWNMGSKISVDSATLMNKGLEVIEAKWLYDIDYNKISVTIHPQSIIHSMVEFNDNSIIAQLSVPSMKLPIEYALTYPDREKGIVKQLDFFKVKKLTFRKPNLKLFECLDLAYKAGKIGGSMPCAVNATNEVLVKKFLENKIGFFDIASNIKKIMKEHNPIKNPSIEEILNVDKKIRKRVEKMII